MIEPACPADEDLWPLVVGEASDDSMQQHVKQCDLCREKIRQLTAEMDTLRRLAEGDKHADTPEASFDTIGGVDGASPQPDVERIGRYRMVRLLGEGGQAIVYRAVDPNLGQEVVVKWSKRELEAVAGDRSRIVQEGQLLAELDHPHLARVLDLGLQNNRPYLVLKFVRGTSLTQYARQQPLNASEMAAMLAKVADAVAAAHDHGVTHQDIKPDNIIIDQSGEPQLIDFGMAVLRSCWLEQTGDEQIIAGTPSYMSPEQAVGDSDRIGPASDVFALGAVLYWLITDKRPYAAATTYETLYQAGECAFDRELVRNSNAPRGLQEACLKAMSKDPRDRHANARQLAHELRSISAPSRRATLAAIAAGACLLSIAAVVFAIVSGNGEAVEPAVSVRIMQGGESTELAKSLPARNGSMLSLQGTIPDNFRYAIFLLSADGELRTLTEQSESGREGRRLRITFPRDGRVARLVGEPGTDVLLFCARENEPIDERVIRQLLSGQGAWPGFRTRDDTASSSSVQFNPQRSWISGAARGVEFEAALEKPILDRAERLRNQLAREVDYFYGIAFPRSR